MAERTGLEPATPGVTGRYSNQLNYRSNEQTRSIPARWESFQILVGAEGLEPPTFAV